MDAYGRNGNGHGRAYQSAHTSSSTDRGFEPRDEMSERPLKSLVTEMLEQGRRLMRAELRLARTELKREARKASAGTGVVAAGAGLAVLGTFTFVAFLVLALAQLIPAWGAALLVAIALLGGGALLGWMGLQRLKQVRAPRRTMETLKEDSRWAKETIRSAQSQMHGHA
jgi:hypothetical protein